MDRQTAKEEIKKREPDFLEPAPRKVNGHTSYICPECNNGRGSSGDGIALDPHFLPDKKYKCFVCGLKGDVIDLWKLYKGIDNFNEALEGLCDYYGIQIDNSPVAPRDFKPEQKTKAEQYTRKEAVNRMDYFRACAGRIGQTDYFKKRGIGDKVTSKHGLGLDSNYTNSTDGKIWNAVIIPTSQTTYVARNTATDAPKGDRYRKNGGNLLYLKENLTEAHEPVFIVEGELDALSIIEVGGTAVALGSTSNYGKLIQEVQKQKPTQPLILALDNDEDGQNTTNTLANELNRLDISFYRYNPYGNAKDANEALVASRENFTEEIRKAVEEARNMKAEELQAREQEFQAQKEEYKKNSAAEYLSDFMNGIADSVNTPYIHTGFPILDKLLDGGLYEGLYFIGAVSSLGKTTFVLQMADQIAESGEDVIIFSLEMSKTELMARSISRLTILDVEQNNGRRDDAKTCRGITTGAWHKYYSETEKELMYRAMDAYGKYAENIYIYEGMGDIGVQEVRDIVDRHILFTGKRPVVIIDYMQMLAPADVRATDKQNTDKAVLELKRISRDYKLPVICVSSFNRENYKYPVKMESFKESGSIEYSCDVLIGLQFKGVGSKDFDVEEAKDRFPREIELVILKNRNGATGKKIAYDYYQKYNWLKEIEEVKRERK